jgi:hypothetical protein
MSGAPFFAASMVSSRMYPMLPSVSYPATRTRTAP